jgi:hypothetical protein
MQLIAGGLSQIGVANSGLAGTPIHRVCVPLLLLALLAAVIVPVASFAQGEPEQDGGPLLLSVFPALAQPGRTVKAEARGVRLDGVYAVWSEGGRFRGRILNVEEVKDQTKQRINLLEKLKVTGPFYRALIELQIDPKAHNGTHLLRLVSARGVSNPIGFFVMDAPITVETPGSHQTINQSQLATVPGLANGKIGELGEVDYYSFLAKKGLRLQFEVVAEQKFDAGVTLGKFAPELALFRAGGSWFDPHRPSRVLFEEERSSDLMHLDASGTYGFTEDGQYFLQVSGLFGQGCPECTYQVRVASCEDPCRSMALNEPTFSEWSERSFSRNLEADWLGQLEARSVKAPEVARAKPVSAVQAGGIGLAVEPAPKEPNLPSSPAAVVENHPTGSATRAESISVPAIMEGTIEHPGEVDSFKFKVGPGQKLAFEVETSGARPPYFNPRLGVVDSQDHELFSNVERRLSMFNNNADPQVYLKAVQPKAIYSFERGGEYTLQIRDVTSRYAGSNYHYRILVRPEIPHVGEILVLARDLPYEVAPGAPKPTEINRINLARKEPKKLILVASYEEGFTGDLSFFLTGLPQGVQAFPAAQFNDGRAPLEVTQNPDVIAPKQQKAVMVLLASPEAPLTTEPRTVQLHCQPVANGRLGADLLVREIPLMVVEGSMPKEEDKPQSGK